MIYICIPTHNEQQTVGVVLWKLRQVLTEFPRDHQLLVADDASTDKTLDVLEPYTRVLPLTVIRNEQRRGWAASMEMLLREAVRRSEYPKRDVIVTLQADFSEEPEDVIALIKRMEAGADVAVGIKVSTAKESSMRRLARSLSRFFTRRLSWPEGVATPFDSYRAYRLYAVKRAMDDRPGQRLLRYDGWAGQAELLRAVLPHARRVDALEVEDRSDRLQRPRREKPLASAWQVRALASGAQPAGLLGVEELDRTAATASRSRDRALSVGNGGTARGNGAGRRGSAESRGRGDRQERERGRGRGPRGDRPREGGPREGAQTRSGTRSGTGTGARRSKAAGAEGDGRRRKRPARSPEATAATDPAEDAAQPTAAAPGEAAPKKRRRRRRSRGSGEPGGTAAPNNGAAETVEADEGAIAAAEDDSPEGGDAPRRRRRRGGRRGGGRTRRRADTPEATADGAAAADSGSAGAGVGAERTGDDAPAPRPVAEPPRTPDTGSSEN